MQQHTPSDHLILPSVLFFYDQGSEKGVPSLHIIQTESKGNHRQRLLVVRWLNCASPVLSVTTKILMNY